MMEGELDHHTASRVRSALITNPDGAGEEFDPDLSRVTFMDSVNYLILGRMNR